jgi:hypothetical protein
MFGADLKHGDGDAEEADPQARSPSSRIQENRFGGQRRVNNLLRELNEEILQAKREKETPMSPKTNAHTSYATADDKLDYTSNRRSNPDSSLTTSTQTPSMHSSMRNACISNYDADNKQHRQQNHSGSPGIYGQGDRRQSNNLPNKSDSVRSSSLGLMDERDTFRGTSDYANYAEDRHRKEQRAKTLLASLRKNGDSVEEERKPLVADESDSDDKEYTSGTERDSRDAWNKEEEREAKVLSRALHEDDTCAQDIVELENDEGFPDTKNITSQIKNTRLHLDGRQTPESDGTHNNLSKMSSSSATTGLETTATSSSNGDLFAASTRVIKSTPKDEDIHQDDGSHDQAASYSSSQQAAGGARRIGGGPHWDAGNAEFECTTRPTDTLAHGHRPASAWDPSQRGNTKEAGYESSSVARASSISYAPNGKDLAQNGAGKPTNGASVHISSSGQNQNKKAGGLVSGYLSGISLLKNSLAILREDLTEEVQDMRAAQDSIKQLIT